MSYDSMAKTYIGVSDSDMINDSWPIKEYHLHHPLVVDRGVLSSVLPEGIDLYAISELTKRKQKEIAQNIDIDKLPVDRPSGYVGQIALYEALREFNVDFSYVLDKTEYEWDVLGFTILYFLLKYNLVGHELGYEDVDLTLGFLESKEEGSHQDRHEQLWMDRLMRAMNFVNENFNYLRHEQLRIIFKKLHDLHDWKKITYQRIQSWCGCSKSQANRLNKILPGIHVSRFNYLIPQKFGLVHSFSKDYTAPLPNTTSFFRCLNVGNDLREYVSYTIDFPSQIDTPQLTTSFRCLNISLYDVKSERWTLDCKTKDVASLRDCNSLVFIPNHFEENKKQRVSQRDVFLTALLLNIPLNNPAMLNITESEYLHQILSVDPIEAKNGLRCIRQKNLIYPSYPLGWHLGPKRYFLILSQNSSQDLTSYIASLTQSIPRFVCRVSADERSMAALIPMPSYLENEFVKVESSLRSTYDVDCELFRVGQYLSFSTSSLMSFLPNFDA